MKYRRKKSHTKKFLTTEEINKKLWKKSCYKRGGKSVNCEDVGLILGWATPRYVAKREAEEQIKEQLEDLVA